MTTERNLLRATPFDAARSIALRYLEQARAAAPRLADEADEEALHDFRVAVRRLRTTLRAWRALLAGVVPREHARAWDDLQRESGAGRDAQVALSWIAGERESAETAHHAGIDLVVNARLDPRWRDAMTAARTTGRTTFDRLDATLRTLLKSDGPDEGTTFADALLASVCRHAQRLSRILRRVRKRKHRRRIHKLRIAGKRLRYLLEPLQGVVAAADPVLEQCRAMQGLLGDLNDAFVLESELTDVLDGSAVDPESGERLGVEELRRRVRRREKRLFKRLRSRWLETGAADLLEAVGTLVHDLATEATDPYEIEHKYLLDALPACVSSEGAARVVEIHQGWLPGDRFRERLRRKTTDRGVQYTRSIKFGKGVRRVEVEEEVSEAFFARTWPLTEGARVLKRRHVVREGEHDWELDEFLDRDLLLAEVELDDEQARVEPPAWLAPHVVRQVTNDPSYVNVNLAR